MEKLKKFNLEDDYLEIKESLEYPTLSLTDDNGKVWVKEKPISYIVAKYYINEDDVNKPILLWRDYSSLQYANYYIIDGEQIDNKNSSLIDYTFNSIGEHTVELYFKENLDSLSYGFEFSSNLISVDLSNFDASNVTTMNNMFNSCSYLTSVTFGDNFDTSKVTDMHAMFYQCYGLTSLDLSNFNTSNVTDMSGMFSNCENLTSLDLSGWDISKVEYSDCAFYCVNNDVVIGIDPTLDIFYCMPPV